MAELALPEEAILALLAVGHAAAEDAWEGVGRAATAAALLELLLAGRIDVAFGWRTRLSVRDATPIGPPALDEALADLAGRSRPPPVSSWVTEQAPEVRWLWVEPLVARGLLQRVGEHYVAAPERVRPIDQRVVDAVDRPEAADLRTIALATLLGHAQAVVFPSARLRPEPDGFRARLSAKREDFRVRRRARELPMTFGRRREDRAELRRIGRGLVPIAASAQAPTGEGGGGFGDGDGNGNGGGGG